MKITPRFIASVLVLSAAFAASPDPARTRQLLGVVQSNAELADRARALQQLALVASPEAVPVLAGLLGDEHLGQYARDGLERLPDATAGAALHDALGRLQGNALVGVVHSLGLRRETAAVPALEKLVAVPPPAGRPCLFSFEELSDFEGMSVTGSGITIEATRHGAASWGDG
jgi:HEAT repeat protein